MSDREREAIRHEVEMQGGFYFDQDEYMDEYGEYFEERDVIIKRQKTSKGEVKIYKCPHCAKVIPRDAWGDDCIFCFGSINWRRAGK